MAVKFLDSTGLTYFINKIVYGITSPKFSTGSTYTVGNFVIYTGKLYRCTTAVTVAGAWSASHWTATTVSAELATINSNMSLIKTYVGTDGKLHSVDATGADSVLPFSSVTKYDKLFSKGLTLVTGDWIPKVVSGTGSYARMENNSLVIHQSSGAGTSAYISTPIAIDLSSYDYVEFKINTYTLTGSQSEFGPVNFGVKSAISDSTGETFSRDNWLKKIQKTKAQMTSAGNKFIVDVTGISSGYITFGTWYVTGTDVVCSVEEVALVKV